MNKTIYLGLHLFTLFSMFTLFSQTPKNISPPKEEDVNQETPTSREMLEENTHVLVRGNNIFAFELYRLLKETPGNLCFSPYSITSAMAIPYTGAQDGSLQEMRTVMHYLTQPRQGNEVFQSLNKFYTTPWFLGSNECRLFLGNSLWIQRDYTLLKSYSEMVNFFFPGGVKFVDFVRNPEGARYNINTWVREKTQGRISEEAQKQDVAAKPTMILVSSAFMKGVWSFPFNPALTKTAPFFLDKQTTTSVQMMSLSGRFKILQGEDVSIIELPYRAGYSASSQFSLLVILPQSNFGLASIEEKFYNDNWLNWISKMQDRACIVSLPKFKTLQTFDITPLLIRLGMQNTYSDQADFTGISSREGLALNRVIQGTYFSIDEKGSDAIAVNPLAGNDTTHGSAEGALVLKADHPFLYVVVDKIRGTILFLGRFSTPDQIKVTSPDQNDM